MIRLTFKILLFCAVVLNSSAQTYFNKVYPYGSLVANASAVIEIDTGGYLFPSCTFGSYSSFLINRINANGDTLFTKEYYKPSCSFGTGASNSIIKAFDNNYVLCGSLLDSFGNRNALLVKLTDSGDTLWSKTYGGSSFDNANIVCQTSDSGFVLMGVTQSYSTGSASDFYLIKTDKNGVFQWQQVYGTTLAEDCLSGQITLDGGFVLSGQKNGQFYIVKTNSLGGLQWQQSYPGTSGPCFIKQLPDSTYVLSGAKIISGFAGQGYLIKINKTGGIVWQNHYGSSTVNDWFYTQPAILSDGSIVIAGQQMLGSNSIGLLVKTDSLGNQQWLRTYTDATTTSNEYFYDVKHTLDNGFIMSGFTQHGWLVKVDSNGCEIANCNVGINEIEDDILNLKIYPNPSNDYAKVEIKLEDPTQKAELIIYNILGAIVLRQNVSNNDLLTVNTKEYQNGIYLFVLKTEQGIIEKQKVIVAK